ncbi:MAG: hypothetical protein XD93_0555 [candidate division WS6 bacterium 34_10]|uniref:Dystroglycan-type cadherin-like domain-containing protein n=1 Tax=candidate division WS6 bacterium 34_10 TaxID=1641389 RepID=A0A117M049_9BACT|nr:MAG: hypothetical protein XD93_0555 [candidate division WS6 bacterium 34_10]
MKEGFENWLIVFAIIVVSGVIFYFALPNNQNQENEVMGVNNRSFRNAPYIVSVAPASVKVGEFLQYKVRVSDLDSNDEEISIVLEESPDWMYIQEGIVQGSPSELGTYKYVVTVSDGVNSTSQINYILVEANE